MGKGKGERVPESEWIHAARVICYIPGRTIEIEKHGRHLRCTPNPEALKQNGGAKFLAGLTETDMRKLLVDILVKHSGQTNEMLDIGLA